MNVLVAYATRHGSTAGIAECIATTLTEHARPVEEVKDVDGFDAVVLGGCRQVRMPSFGRAFDLQATIGLCRGFYGFCSRRKRWPFGGRARITGYDG